MPYDPTDQEWIATLDGAPHLERRFWMPAGSNEGQARYRVVEICSWARGGDWSFERPTANFGLVVRLAEAERVFLDARPAESYVPARSIAA